MPKKGLPHAAKDQPSILSVGVTSKVLPLPVDEKAFADAKNFVTQCKDVLVGQIVHVRGNYWEGSLSHEEGRLFPCKVLR
jgi:hypothetical protein